MAGPRYPHRCAGCRFIGRIDYLDVWTKSWIEADLYYCDAAMPGEAVVARVGPQPSAYASASLADAEQRRAPFSTTGRALYAAAINVIAERRKKPSHERLSQAALPADYTVKKPK